MDSLPQPKRYRVSAKWLFGLTALTLLVPVLMVFVIFPWLGEQAFGSVEEIDPAQDTVGEVIESRIDAGRLLRNARLLDA